MNGEALTKRYEVRDAETGEVVEGPLYVLRPTEDIVARSAMFCYAHLLGLADDTMIQRVIAMPRPNSGVHSDDPAEREMWQKVFVERMSPPEDTISQNGEQFVGAAALGQGDGSMKRAVALMESCGYELAFCAFREIDDERRDQAKSLLREMDNAETDRRNREQALSAGSVRDDGTGRIHLSLDNRFEDAS